MTIRALRCRLVIIAGEICSVTMLLALGRRVVIIAGKDNVTEICRVMTIWALRRWVVIIAGEVRSVMTLLARGRWVGIIAEKIRNRNV